MPPNLNDGSSNPPHLKVFLNLGTLADLPTWSIWPRIKGVEAMKLLKAAGFEGVQDGKRDECREAGILSAGSGRIDKPQDAEPLAGRLKSLGHQCGTLHVGS